MRPLRLQFQIPSIKAMLDKILIVGHIICFLITTPLGVVIYKYLKKKSFGMQSIIDLLIIDMIKVNTFNSIIWICFILVGSTSVQVPFVPSLVWSWILINSNVYLFCLYQFFLLTKTIVIFKGFWLEEINDSKIVWTSRVFALCCSSVRFIGDYWAQPSRLSKSPMMSHLTGISSDE